MTKITYSLEQIYLELARSAVQSSFITLYRSSKEERNLNYENNIRFAGVAASIVFSYAAMEAFVNCHLHSVYCEIKDSNIDEFVFRNINHKKYFIDDKIFDDLLWEKLLEKLKILASSLNIEPIDTRNPELWKRIGEVTEKVRHFIIHPKPWPEEFNQVMQKIMQEYVAGEYSNIATETIRYFYSERRPPVAVPEWLIGNIIFRFLNSKDIDKTFDEIRNKLQTSRTVLEYLKEGKEIPKDFVDRAIKDLDTIVR